MALQPQLADLDGDGHRELITGYYGGGLYRLDGKPGNQFGARGFVLDESGAVLRLGQYWDEPGWKAAEGSEFPQERGIAVATVDWEADGDVDLLLGSESGGLYLHENLGSPTRPSFSSRSVQVLADGAAAKVPGKHAIPCAADWDGDGRWDVLSGSDEGSVAWFRNIGSAAKPAFASPAMLIERNAYVDAGLGKRTQVSAGDWDGDGRVDLLVGDYNLAAEKPKSHGYVWFFRRLPKGSD